MSDGFFLMHRGWRDNPIFKGEFSRADAWVWLIENACWKPARTRIKGETVTLDRGELSFSIRFLAEAWGWSKSRVDRFLSDLRDEGMIEARSKIGTAGETKAGQGQSILTICNYRKYQDQSESQRDNSGTTRGTTAGQQRDKEEQRNKGTRVEEEPNGSPSTDAGAGEPKPAQSSLLPDDPRPAAKPAKAKRTKPAPVSVIIPDWMPVEPWNAFLEMRQRKSAKPTDRAVTLLIGKLDELRANGHDPGKVLDQSTVKNWTDVYPLKDQPNATYHRQEPDRRDGFERALDRDIERFAAERSAREADGSAYHDAGNVLPLPQPQRRTGW